MRAEQSALTTANLVPTTVAPQPVADSVDEEVAAVALAVAEVVAVAVETLEVAVAVVVVEVVAAEVAEEAAPTVAASETSLAARRPSKSSHVMST